MAINTNNLDVFYYSENFTEKEWNKIQDCPRKVKELEKLVRMKLAKEIAEKLVVVETKLVDCNGFSHDVGTPKAWGLSHVVVKASFDELGKLKSERNYYKSTLDLLKSKIKGLV